jgi:hypothetical protein
VLDVPRDAKRAEYFGAERDEREQLQEGTELLQQRVIKEVMTPASSSPLSQAHPGT